MSKLEASQYGLEIGTPDLKSIGPITFSPDGILFVADNLSATVFAIDLGDVETGYGPAPIDIDNLDTRLASYLGCSREEIFIRDMAVNPVSQRVYLSVMRGTGNAGIPLLIEVEPDGSVAEVELAGVPFSQTTIADAPSEDDTRLTGRVLADTDTSEGEEREARGTTIRIVRESLRSATVTDLAYVDDVLIVAGASNEEFCSTLRRIPFPFSGDQSTSSLEIFHVSHGKYETASPIRSFAVYGEGILASYTCTPVVHFSLDDIKSGAQAKGRTVAELGSMNTPIDMLSYTRDGEEFLLVANTRHPLMKIAARDVARQEPLTAPQEPLGVPREDLPQSGVNRLASRNGDVLMLQRDEEGKLALRSYDTATL